MNRKKTYYIYSVMLILALALHLSAALPEQEAAVTEEVLPADTLNGADRTDLDAASGLWQALLQLHGESDRMPADLYESGGTAVAEIVYQVRETAIPFGKEVVYDSVNLTIGAAETIPGRDGLLKELWICTYEDGKLTGERLVDTAVTVPPSNEQLVIGRKWNFLDLDLSNAVPFEAELTAYHDEITATGDIPVLGTVAVDPTVIPLYTRLYIPGYGIATALDVGGAVKGNVIDLYFEDPTDMNEFGRRRYTVYILPD